MQRATHSRGCTHCTRMWECMRASVYLRAFARRTKLSTSWLLIEDDCPWHTWRRRVAIGMQAARREKRIGAAECRLTRETELNVSYVLCIAKQGAIGSTRSFGGTYSRVGERTARFDEEARVICWLCYCAISEHKHSAEGSRHDYLLVVGYRAIIHNVDSEMSERTQSSPSCSIREPFFHPFCENTAAARVNAIPRGGRRRN